MLEGHQNVGIHQPTEAFTFLSNMPVVKGENIYYTVGILLWYYGNILIVSLNLLW